MNVKIHGEWSIDSWVFIPHVLCISMSTQTGTGNEDWLNLLKGNCRSQSRDGGGGGRRSCGSADYMGLSNFIRPWGGQLGSWGRFHSGPAMSPSSFLLLAEVCCSLLLLKYLASMSPSGQSLTILLHVPLPLPQTFLLISHRPAKHHRAAPLVWIWAIVTELLRLCGTSGAGQSK